MANNAPRPGVTFEQVAASATKMFDHGTNPTIRNIREAIGGSPNTIQKHLATWREGRLKATTEIPALPANLTATIAAEIARAAAEAKTEVEDMLAQAQSENSELAIAGEALEQEREDLQEQLRELTAQYNNLLGKSEEQANVLARVCINLERERKEADLNRVESAQQKIKIDSLTEKLDEKSAVFDQLTTTRSGDIERFNAETQAKSVAEKSVAVMEAKLNAALEQVENLKTRENKLAAEVEKERQVTEKVRADVKNMQAKSEVQAAKIAEQSQTISNQKVQLGVTEKKLGVAEKELTKMKSKVKSNSQLKSK